MNYIVLDLEFNQAYDFQDGNSAETNAACPFEIIQIGAVKLDKNFEIIDQLDILIKPQIYTRIHPVVERITCINAQMLCDQVDFPAAYEKLLAFIGNKRNILVVWGGNDIKELYKNILYHGLDYTRAPIRYINIQGVASLYFNNNKGISIGLKNAVEGFQIEANLPFHNALNDAIYTALILKRLKNEATAIQKFNIKVLKITPPKPIIRKNDLNSNLLYTMVEKELGRKITAKEKKIFKSVYLLGRNKQFDAKK